MGPCFSFCAKLENDYSCQKCVLTEDVVFVCVFHPRISFFVSLQRFMPMEFATCGVAPLTAVTPLPLKAEAGCFVVTWARTNTKR